jgi:hypothetical protein
LTGSTSIESDDEAGTGGRHHAVELCFEVGDADAVELERQNDAFRKEAVYDCAGYAALIVAGYSEAEAKRGCASDFDAAGRNAYTTLDAAKQQAVALMRQPKNVAAVRRVADELLLRNMLDPWDVGFLIEIADGKCTEADYQRFVLLRDASQREPS